MSELTISQALRHGKKLKGRLKEATDRAALGVSYKVNQKPAFAFGASMEQAALLRKELRDLTVRVRVMNATTTIDFDGRKLVLADAVAQLEDMKGQLAWLKGLTVKTQETTQESEWSYNESSQRVMVQENWQCDMPEAKRAAEVDKIQDQFDKLNDAVEKVNHVTVLKSVT